MLTNRLVSRCAAHSLGRGGFTLVELLVVIGIIAILAGVSLGPITGAMKKAKQNTGMQTGRSIALAEFSFANDNNESYPDKNVPSGNSGNDASTVAKPLLAGNYVSDPTIFFISGDAGATGKYTGTPVTNIAVSNISWDFGAGATGNGLDTNTPDQCPVLISTVHNGTAPASTLTSGTALTCLPVSANPFGADGVVVVFKSNSAKFQPTSTLTGTPTCTLVDSPSVSSPFTFAWLAGQ